MKKVFLFIAIIILCLSTLACSLPLDNNDNPDNGGLSVSQLREEYLYDINNKARATIYSDTRNDRIVTEKAGWVGLLKKRAEEKIMLAETEEEMNEDYLQFSSATDFVQKLFRTNPGFRWDYLKEKAFSGEVDGISFEVSSWPLHPTNSTGLKLLTSASDDELEFRMYAKGCTFWNGTGYAVVKSGDRADVDDFNCEVENGAYIVAIIAKGEKIYGFAVVDYFKDLPFDEDENKRFYAYTFEESSWLTVTEQQILANVAGEEDNLPDMERCKVGEKNWSDDVTLILRSKGKNSDAPEIEFADKYVSSFNFEGVEYEVFSETPFTYAGQKVNSAILQPNESIVWSDQSGKNGGLGVIVRREGKIVGVCVIIVPQKSGLGIEASFISVCYKFEIDKDIYYFSEYLALGYDPDEDFARAVIDGYIKEYVE